MEENNAKILGIFLTLIGLSIFYLGGVKGFGSGDILATLAYIIGPVIGFIGIYFLVVYGRERARDQY